MLLYSSNNLYEAIFTLLSFLIAGLEFSKVGSMFGQIGATGRKVGGHFGQRCPNFENFAWTKMRGFGKIWDQTIMGIIRGPLSGWHNL